MEYIKTTKCAAMALLIAATSVFAAEEMPDPRQFTEVTNQIWRDSTDANVAMGQFKDKERLNEESRQDKKKEYAQSIENYKEAYLAYTKNQTPDNLQKMEEARKKQQEAQAALADVISNKILGKIDFVNDMSKRFVRLSRSYNKLGTLAENYKGAIDSMNAGSLNYQVKSGIVMVGEQVQQMLKIDPENKALQQAMATVEKQAKLYKTLGTKFTVDEQIKEQAEILADLAASLAYVKQNLEAQKEKLKMAVIRVTIREAFKGLDIRGGELPASFLEGIVELDNDIDDFEKMSSDDDEKKEDTTNDRVYGAWQSLKDSL